MVAGLGSLTSSPPLTSKMWSKVSMRMAEKERAQQAPQKVPQQPTKGAQQAPQKAPQQPTKGAQQAPQKAPQKAPQQAPQQPTEEGAMSAAPEAEAAALRGIRRPCSLLV